MSATYKGRDAAIQESFRNQCQGEYFRARPQLDFASNNRLFERAFDMGWTSAMAESERRIAAVLYLFAWYFTARSRDKVGAFAKRFGISLANPDTDAFPVVDDSVEMSGPPPDTVPGDVVVQQMIDKAWARFCAVADGYSAGQDSQSVLVPSVFNVRTQDPAETQADAYHDRVHDLLLKYREASWSILDSNEQDAADLELVEALSPLIANTILWKEVK